MSDSLPEAIKKLSEAADKLGNFADAMQRIQADAFRSVVPPAPPPSSPAAPKPPMKAPGVREAISHVLGRVFSKFQPPDEEDDGGREKRRRRPTPAKMPDAWDVSVGGRSPPPPPSGTPRPGGGGAPPTPPPPSGGPLPAGGGKVPPMGPAGAAAAAASDPKETVTGLMRVAGGGLFPMAETALAAAKKLDELRRAVVRLTDEQIAAARRLSENSGAMAGVFAQREVREILRDMRQGNAQAASAGRLARAEQDRNDALEGLENALANISNNTLALLNEVAIPVLEIISDGAKGVERLVEWFTGDVKPPKPPEPVGLGGEMPGVEEEARRIERRAETLMGIARAAAGRIGGGVAGPEGAAPVGRLP